MKDIENYKSGDEVWIIRDTYIIEGVILSIEERCTHNYDFYVLIIKDKITDKTYEESIESNIYKDYASAVQQLIKVFKQQKKKLKETKNKIKEDIMEINNKLSSLKHYMMHTNWSKYE